jgi:1-acyl-sn-glycerol-3-phosphate acyltransferase
VSQRALSRKEPFPYRVLQAWARTALHVFIRRADVTGLHRIPVDRPALLAANHSNAMADVAAIVAFVPRFPHFLAAASWWKVAPARLLFKWGGVVPIHRRRDSDAEQNVSTFEACHAALARGDHLAIFPEGEMHLEPALMPLKTGAARIVLGAAADAGIPGVALIPIGIVYDVPSMFRTIGEFHVGEPIEADEWVELYSKDPSKAVRAVTDELAERLAAATVNNESRAASTLLDRAAELALADDADWPEDVPYSRRNMLRRALARAIARAGGESSGAFRDLSDAVRAHADDLARLGVDPGNATPTLTPPTVFQRTRLRVQLVVLAPAGLLGLVANAPTIGLTWVAARRVENEGWKLTVKGLAASLLSPLVWGGEFALLSRRLGRGRAAALVAAGGLGGLASIAWWEHRTRLRQIAWEERVELERPAQLVAARASRIAVRRRVEALVGTRSRAGLE